MDQKTIFLVILGMAAVTYIPRLVPVWLLASRKLPPLVVAWLQYVPVAVLAALLLPELIVRDHQIALGGNNLFFWAAIPTFIIAWRTKSLFGSVFVGMLIVAAVRALGA